MRHTYSSVSIKPEKIHRGEIKNFNFFPIESPLFSGFRSPKSASYISKNEKKISKKSHTNTNSKVNLNFIDKEKSKNNSINIRLNIKSAIINNNYNENKAEELNKGTKDDMLEIKDKIIHELQKEIKRTKHQINNVKTSQNLKNSIDKFDNSENFLNEKICKIQNKERSKLSTIKTSSVISKNVRQFFKNLILKNSKSTSKTATPTSLLNNGNLKISLNPNHNNSINSHFYTTKALSNGTHLDIDTMFSTSPRFVDKYYKTMTKSNSLIISQQIQPSKRKVQRKKQFSSPRNNQLKHQDNNNIKFVSNSTNISNANYCDFISEFDKIKNRTQDVLNGYLKMIKQKKND